MADSTLAIPPLTTLVDDTANAPSVINGNFNSIFTKFNASMDTETGHFHDGTDSRLVVGGVSGWSMEELALAISIGLFVSA